MITLGQGLACLLLRSAQHQRVLGKGAQGGTAGVHFGWALAWGGHLLAAPGLNGRGGRFSSSVSCKPLLAEGQRADPAQGLMLLAGPYADPTAKDAEPITALWRLLHKPVEGKPGSKEGSCFVTAVAARPL